MYSLVWCHIFSSFQLLSHVYSAVLYKWYFFYLEVQLSLVVSFQTAKQPLFFTRSKEIVRISFGARCAAILTRRLPSLPSLPLATTADILFFKKRKKIVVWLLVKNDKARVHPPPSPQISAANQIVTDFLYSCSTLFAVLKTRPRTLQFMELLKIQ